MTSPVSVPEDLRARTRRLISWQIVTGLVVAAGYYLARGPWEALSAAYGGGLSLTMALLLSLSVALATTGHPGGQGQLILYGGAALRFVLVLVLFAIGLAVIGLAPIAMVAGFAAVQLVFLLAAAIR